MSFHMGDSDNDSIDSTSGLKKLKKKVSDNDEKLFEIDSTKSAVSTATLSTLDTVDATAAQHDIASGLRKQPSLDSVASQVRSLQGHYPVFLDVLQWTS